MTEYIPTVWQNGDAITAEKLNKIETRISEIQQYQKSFSINLFNIYYEKEEELDE